MQVTGYARNFLFPKKLAVPADKGNMNDWQNRKDSAEFKKEEERKNATKQKEQIEGITLEIKAKTGENGKLFGAITSKEVAENLEKQYKLKVDKKKIIMENIKNLGDSIVEIKLFEGIVAKLKIKTIAN